MKRNKAKKVVEGLVSLRKSASDAQASTAVQLYPTLKGSGELIKAGTRINWNGQLMRAAVDLWDIEQNNPDNAPTLWESIDYINGIRKIPEVITVGLAFSAGEKGYWRGVIYISMVDNNIYNPDQYAPNWKIVE